MRRFPSRRKQGGWLAHRGGSNTARTPVNLVIAADQAALYNAFTAAGSPGGLCDVTVTVNAGKTLQQGFTMGAFAAGSSFKLTNNGTICGLGGVGGAGDTVIDASHVSGAQSGFAGGPAIVMTGPLSIDNTNGQINGGGGGGGGGGFASRALLGSWATGNTATGGGGAAGRGYNNAAGGAAGANGLGGAVGTAGTAGSSASAGTPGPGTSESDKVGPGTSGGGGAGGDWGNPGGVGVNGTGNAADAGQPGGAAGNAVTTNGFALTWIAGNNPTQVKGPII